MSKPKAFNPLEKAADFNRRSSLKDDGGLRPPSAQTVRELRSLTGFTLVELIVVFIIISIIAGFSVVSYTAAILKSHERQAILQLNVLHDANEIYRARYHQYLPGSSIGTALIESGLNINIIDGDFVFTYTRNPADVNRYTATANKTTGSVAEQFTLGVHEGHIDMSNNPCCVGGGCPSSGIGPNDLHNC